MRRASIVQIRGLMLDVTEQRMFQSQLQRERDFNQKILNTTQSMILVLDTAGLISYANRRCFEAGYRQEEFIGQRLVGWLKIHTARILKPRCRPPPTANRWKIWNCGLNAAMAPWAISLSV